MSGFDLVRSPTFDRHLRKLDRQVQRRVLVALYELPELPDPTERLKPLQHSKVGLWRLRVGDHRVIVSVPRSELTVIAIDVGDRSSIYD